MHIGWWRFSALEQADLIYLYLYIYMQPVIVLPWIRICGLTLLTCFNGTLSFAMICVHALRTVLDLVRTDI